MQCQNLTNSCPSHGVNALSTGVGMHAVGGVPGHQNYVSQSKCDR